MTNILEDNIDYLEKLLLALRDIKLTGEDNMVAAENYKVRLDLVDSLIRIPINNLELIVSPNRVEKLNPGMPIANTSLDTKVKNILLENGFNTVRQINDDYNRVADILSPAGSIEWIIFKQWWTDHRNAYDFTMGVAVNQPVEEKLNPSMPVANTDLDVRTKNILTNNSIFTVRQLYGINGLDLRRMFGDDANSLFHLNQWMRTSKGKFEF